MSEETPKEEKKLTGFALNKENINLGGRPRGAKGKKNIPSEQDIKDEIKHGSTLALNVLKDAMKSETGANKLRAAIKWVDLTMTILDEDKEVKVVKKSDEPAKKKKEDHTGSVVSFKRTVGEGNEK
tara:strand:+ start:1399 stop:1776 length:378 start_codon:yes stop_codon:yes gene_type:complete